MSDGSNRRDFLKGIFGQAAERAPRFIPGAPLLNLVRQQDADDTTAEPRAPAAQRKATLEDLSKLAVKAGLIANLEAVQALARPSVRLTLDRNAQPATGWTPSLLDAAAAGEAEPRELLLSLDLHDAVDPSSADSSGLTGTLTVELDETRWCHLALARSDPHPQTGAADESEPAPPSLAAHRGTSALLPLGLTGELVLPRAWSEEVQSRGLTQSETEAWIELRELLAAFQGTDLPGEREETTVIHRLLGHPDERSGDMPLACELAARGIEHDGPPFSHPRASELAPAAGRWQLLLQLSADELLDWYWGPGEERLYVWIDKADLAAGELSRTRTIIG